MIIYFFRFDLLSGFNGQEGAVLVFLPTFMRLTNESIQNGMSREYIRLAVTNLCNAATPLSVNLCIDFFIRTYELDSFNDDKQRGIRLSQIFGKFHTNTLYLKKEKNDQKSSLKVFFSVKWDNSIINYLKSNI